jgi:hypothetical protein
MISAKHNASSTSLSMAPNLSCAILHPMMCVLCVSTELNYFYITQINDMHIF